ncbi:hypothetical protein L227DRAFT_353994 [Lentinus tigrinus ALCF2SS1-6]|uniref:Uncharacterized protein n=1 Tax=Lentinus tigrinus ALCF2SS1-6 TaxID=1328759 RepID=A0A5C2RSS4_9APHY|nr:hypothetical protein L227DRAFT_353994 [Lentinus tigrinus ALCF2SS1-6]
MVLIPRRHSRTRPSSESSPCESWLRSGRQLQSSLTLRPSLDGQYHRTSAVFVRLNADPMEVQAYACESVNARPKPCVCGQTHTGNAVSLCRPRCI